MQMDKAFRCAKLFQEQYWGEIVEILRVLDEKKKQTKNMMEWKNLEDAAGKQFKEICDRAHIGVVKGFSGKELSYPDWLWNYLKNFDSDLTDTPCW
jgi:hypothetical protein